MKLLGAIIAGGASRRFGGDKGAALLNGRALIDHVRDALVPQVDAMVIVGRKWPGIEMLSDRPAPDLGPLGGLNAALHAAQQNGFDAVVTAGCDVLPVPVFHRHPGLDPGSSFLAGVVADQPLFGVWPAGLAEDLEAHLTTQTDHSMRHWIAVSGAREVPCDTPFHNLNTRADFALYSASQGLAA